MKRAVLALSIAAVTSAVAWPAARGLHAENGVCELMTPAKMLTNPRLASEYAEALRSGDADELARVQSLFKDIRAMHGCGGEVVLPASPRPDTRLPPGHPPIDGMPGTFHGAPRTPIFEAPATLTI
jgi:hypothetical protein